MPLHHLPAPDGLAPPVGYSHVVAARGGTTVYVSGQVALDAEGHVVGEGDLRAQTEQVFANLRAALAAAGATPRDIAKLTTFVVNFRPEHRAVIREVRSRFFAPDTPPPASTLVGVQALVVPELLIEVEAIAVVG